MNKKRSLLSIKVDALIRKILIVSLSKTLPIFTINEYPKSGGSWFAQMFSDYFGLPFPRNSFPSIKPQIFHGHYLYHSNMKNIICVFRDGRDVMVSFYYHSLFLQENVQNWADYTFTQKRLGIVDPENIADNLPKFIEYKFTKREIPKFYWTDFVNEWNDKDIPIIKYEELRANPSKVIFNVIRKISDIPPDCEKISKVIDKYSFSKLSGRKPGDENVNSFLRRGISGEWKEKFNDDAREIFNYYAGDALIALGYEKDKSWAEKKW